MRTWREFIEALTSSPRGWNADGRTLGLGLATAMAKQRERATRTVEDYLRHEAADDRQVPTSG
ncbi:hypothetical protein [Actinophytocola sp.]|uniref:hypothetical protein n=1 Tax=Actinophytocola sp. TaxID=1872138 RepID=UPI003D6C0CC9